MVFTLPWAEEKVKGKAGNRFWHQEQLNMIRRSGMISEEFGKSLEKVAFPVPKWLPAPEVDWWLMRCPDCGEHWGVGREPGSAPPENGCKGKNVNVTKETPGNLANQQNKP